ncbi:hypothetical protein NQ315_009325 [Exocentrus adspersus]|uniref:mRNA export factor GLE1 n=1 Tax=Exocentrus adspersus TaxID=1586481 RepID=A0AAV8WG00_9CUCU|nr:hypothetical protein NQ315_009325 [Exocentrus adspersus]
MTCRRKRRRIKKRPNLNIRQKNQLPIRHILKQLEIQRQEEVNSAIQARLNKFKDFSQQQEADKRKQWLKQQQAFIKDMQLKESRIFEALNEYDKNTSDEHAKLVQHYQNLAERRKMHEKELATREKQRQLVNSYIDNIKKGQQEFRSIYQQIIIILKSCENNEELKLLLGDDFKQLKTLPEQLDEVIGYCKNGKVSEAEVRKVVELVQQVGALYSKIGQAVAKINKKKEEPQKPQNIITTVPPVNNAINEKFTESIAVGKEAEKLSPTLNSNITKYVSLSNLKMYTEIMDFWEKHSESFKILEQDTSLKQFKFECKKAINTPVNSLSGINSSHILDKYNRLYKLLSGQTVIVGEKQINASRHPQGIAFCMDLLAKKFVLQGDLMVSSNPESAFCYATVIISLWNDFPVFGNLVLAYFYKFCPYLVPYYIPRQVGESDEEYYTKQGYQYVDGQIEKQDKFLKRMTGIMRLYSAVLIVKPKRGQNTTPHNIKHGWRLLSSILKLEPQVDISATIVHTLLETAGFELEARYDRFFKKLILILLDKFLPRCREKCTGGAVTRLELLLSEYMKNKRFEQPNGYLNYPYW